MYMYDYEFFFTSSTQIQHIVYTKPAQDRDDDSIATLIKCTSLPELVDMYMCTVVKATSDKLHVHMLGATYYMYSVRST